MDVSFPVEHSDNKIVNEKVLNDEEKHKVSSVKLGKKEVYTISIENKDD